MDKHHGGYVGNGEEERTHGQHEDQAPPTRKERQADSRRSSPAPERKRAPEVGAVETDRLCDELADGSLGRREGGRQRLSWSARRHLPNATSA